MATSNTTAFNLTLEEIVEEAYDRIGMRVSTGYDYRTARRSMDLLFIEWQNRGINFWTLEERSTSLSAGTATYTLGADVFDIIECYVEEKIAQTL